MCEQSGFHHPHMGPEAGCLYRCHTALKSKAGKKFWEAIIFTQTKMKANFWPLITKWYSMGLTVCKWISISGIWENCWQQPRHSTIASLVPFVTDYPEVVWNCLDQWLKLNRCSDLSPSRCTSRGPLRWSQATGSLRWHSGRMFTCKMAVYWDTHFETKLTQSACLVVYPVLYLHEISPYCCLFISHFNYPVVRHVQKFPWSNRLLCINCAWCSIE